jgi:hypothetical protein
MKSSDPVRGCGGRSPEWRGRRQRDGIEAYRFGHAPRPNQACRCMCQNKLLAFLVENQIQAAGFSLIKPDFGSPFAAPQRRIPKRRLDGVRFLAQEGRSLGRWAGPHSTRRRWGGQRHALTAAWHRRGWSAGSRRTRRTGDNRKTCAQVSQGLIQSLGSSLAPWLMTSRHHDAGDRGKAFQALESLRPLPR